MKPTKLPRGSHARGAVLLETLVASAVFAIGVVGVFQGIVIASNQNKMANRMVRASAIAQEIRGAIQAQGYDRLRSATGVLNGDTTSGKPAGGLEALPLAVVYDLDAYELGASSDMKLQPGYTADDRRVYKRVLVRFKADVTSPETANVAPVAVVVSWEEMGNKHYIKQWVYLPRPIMKFAYILL